MPKPVDESKVRHLDPKVRIDWTIEAIGLAALVWLIATVVAQLAFPEGLFGIQPYLYPAVFLIIILIPLLSYVGWVELEYRNYRYYFDETELVIRRGVIRLERIDIPFGKVQNVHVSRSLLERILNIATIKIETAGTNTGEAEGTLPGIADYKDLVEEILSYVEQTRSGGTAEVPKSEKNEDLLREIAALREEIKNMRNQPLGPSAGTMMEQKSEPNPHEDIPKPHEEVPKPSQAATPENEPIDELTRLRLRLEAKSRATEAEKESRPMPEHPKYEANQIPENKPEPEKKAEIIEKKHESEIAFEKDVAPPKTEDERYKKGGNKDIYPAKKPRKPKKK